MKTIQVRCTPVNWSAISTDFSHTGIPEENLKCLQSLFLSDPRNDLAEIRDAKGDRVHGTCAWILTQDRYTSWLVEDSPQLLWLSGAPGIGKTMMSSFLVEELEELAKHSSQMTLAYYFCDDKFQERRTATSILRGLLLQLLRQRPILFKHIQKDFDMKRDSLFTSFRSLWTIFVSIIQDPEVGEVCCLIDALDECEKESRQLFLTSFKELFVSQQSEKTYVKFIVTSRRERDIVESLSAVGPAIRNLQVDSGKVNDDLSKFIVVKVNELSTRKGYSESLKEDVKHALTNKAEGTFLYVSLVLDDINKKANSVVRKRLKELPSGLNNLYDKILSRIEDDDDMEIASSVLHWVAVARRPLTVRELAMARSLGTGEWEGNTVPLEDLLVDFQDDFKRCEPLVYVDTVKKTINLVHQSAKDYLLGAHLQGNGDLSQYHVALDTTNLLIFRTCWTYFCLEEFKQHTMSMHETLDYKLLFGDSQWENLLDDYCFFTYANREWQDHAVAAGPALATDYKFWKEYLYKLPTLRDYWLLQAAAEGQEVVVQQLLENGAELESKDNRGRTPLLWAAVKGREAVVKLLLSRSDVVADSQDKDGRTPLSWAASGGNEAVIKLLLSRSDVIADSPNKDGRTPLSYAASGGNEAVIKLLLSRSDVIADSPDKDGRTPLSYAAEWGYVAVVELLLNRSDVVADSRDKDGRTPLSWATESGHVAVVQLLLSRSDVVADSPDKDGQTPLSLAASNGHKAVVKLLLSRSDVKVDSQDIYGKTPLSSAASIGYEAVVELLLNRSDIIADSPDKQGRTPLCWAARKGHEAVVKLLLSRSDVVADSPDKDGRTPLSLAASNRDEAVVKLLLSRNNVVADSQDKDGRTPLSWAASNGNEAVVQLLLSRSDVVVDSPDKEGLTPIWWAANVNGGHEAVVQLLLSRSDVVADSPDKDGRTPLWVAKGNGHEAVVQLLLSRSDVVADSPDKGGQTPLSLAKDDGHEAVVQLLLSRSDMVADSPDKDGRTPLWQALCRNVEFPAMFPATLRYDLCARRLYHSFSMGSKTSQPAGIAFTSPSALIDLD